MCLKISRLASSNTELANVILSDWADTFPLNTRSMRFSRFLKKILTVGIDTSIIGFGVLTASQPATDANVHSKLHMLVGYQCKGYKLWFTGIDKLTK